jgi:hypothetical protein
VFNIERKPGLTGLEMNENDLWDFAEVCNDQCEYEALK